jgi:SsrA-binding protein
VEKVVATNRKAFHNFSIEETFEAGIVLEGSEVKSLRNGNVSLKESYALVEKGEVYLYNMHIAPYEKASAYSPDPKRKRKLLLHKWEIRRLIGKVRERGYTLIPLKVYFKGPFAKIELGLAKGKKKYDKRKELAEKAERRELERALKEKERGI